jgi:hypothetical protein
VDANQLLLRSVFCSHKLNYLSVLVLCRYELEPCPISIPIPRDLQMH